MTWLYLSSGLFLGWSLGANDAANIFGTAVATRMVRFGLAALVGSVFVILGAVISGGGPTATYSALGEINTLAGAFTAALSAAVTVTWMTKLGLPVSTTHAIVGAILGWDLFSGFLIDTTLLGKILSAWVASPILAGLLAYGLYHLNRQAIRRIQIHFLELDFYTRLGLILVGAFGAYSLGANNIANVMGVFVNANPFPGLRLGPFTLTRTQVLFLIGGIAIATGIYTYSQRVMLTVGRTLFRLSPVDALSVVLAESLVLFLFASERLRDLLLALGLPTVPLVPISSSHAVVGSVVGIGVAKGGGRALNFRVLTRILWAWVLTPAVAGLLCYFALFFMQNVFQQPVYRPVPHVLTGSLLKKLQEEGIKDPGLPALLGRTFPNQRALKAALQAQTRLSGKALIRVIEWARVESLRVDTFRLRAQNAHHLFSRGQWEALKQLHGRVFLYRWQLLEALAALSADWRPLPPGRNSVRHNRRLARDIRRLLALLKQPA